MRCSPRPSTATWTCSGSKSSTSAGTTPQFLSRLDRRFQDQEIRRAFTVFQFMTILEKARYSLIVIEHDPLLYEDAQGMVEYVSQGLHDAAKGRSPALLTWI